MLHPAFARFTPTAVDRLRTRLRTQAPDPIREPSLDPKVTFIDFTKPHEPTIGTSRIRPRTPPPHPVIGLLDPSGLTFTVILVELEPAP